MKIEYLRELESLNSQNLENVFPNRPLSTDEIIQLEQLYNNGKSFPKVLKELLYIAGNRCSVMSLSKNGPFGYQLVVRDAIQNSDHTISRPFYAFDQIDINLFSAVFLDERTEDPVVIHFDLNASNSSEDYMISSGTTLSNFVNYKIGKVQRGYNPY